MHVEPLVLCTTCIVTSKGGEAGDRDSQESGSQHIWLSKPSPLIWITVTIKHTQLRFLKSLLVYFVLKFCQCRNFFTLT